jgi:Na+/H+ antiporter NhaD/arsenite permease-like protein
MRALRVCVTGLLSVMAFEVAHATEEVSFLPEVYLSSFWGVGCLMFLAFAYALVLFEERIHLRKSIPVLVSAGVIWFAVAFIARQTTHETFAGDAFKHAFLEYGELFLFLMVAMTYVNTLQERNMFEWMRYQLLSRNFSHRTIFWITGTCAFMLSPVLDNLTTALVMCSVAIAVGGRDKAFISKSCVSIVVAANAGGTFSPFGDITTLMVWRSGHVEALEFLSLFPAALVNWLVPAACIAFSIRTGTDNSIANQKACMKQGTITIMVLFACTIVLSVSGHQYLHLPPVMGMMLGLGLLKLYSYFLSRYERSVFEPVSFPVMDEETSRYLQEKFKPRHKPFDSLVSVKNVEWDTLLFFYGVILSIAGIGAFGYLAILSEFSYGTFGAVWANIGVGIVSAIVDNIPVMYAVLQMSPEMTHNEWLLVTLTAGVGGSLISIGSAAGVALMGYAQIVDEHTCGRMKVYTFMSHLKWTPAIFAGYVLSIWVHLLTHGMPMPF